MLEETQKTRVLIVEDSKTQAEWLRLTLENSDMDVDCVGLLADCIRLVKREEFSAILLDLTLPDSTGLSTLIAVGANAPSIPVIVLTALEDEALGMDALKNGAEDFLVKGETPPSGLARAVRYAIERKKQARELRQMQRHTREIIERAHEAFIAVDLDGNIIDWNRKAQTLFGWSRLEAVGEKIVELVADTDQTLLSSGIDTFKHTSGGPLVKDRIEINGRNRRGEVFPIELAFFPVQLGPAYMLCSFVTDLTSRKEVQQRMNEFYSVVSHELRSPVTSIRGSLRLLESGAMGDMDKDVQEMVSISVASCDRLIRLISDLLDMSKIESGAMDMTLEDVAPEGLVNCAIDGIQGMASESDIELTSEVSIHRKVRGDSDKILQVLTNLVSNAIKFSPKKGEIKLKAESGSSGTVRFSVIDQGTGIPKKDLHRVFGKFQQLENASLINAKGTGLGLAISKAIVSQLNGDIGVYSEEGKGTTFWFELPCAS